MDICADSKDSKTVYYTGYFRDKKRRIDLILVCKDTGKRLIETLKKQFLGNCMNVGLQLELEAGMSPDTRDLLFIKIHAPDFVIHQFGIYYNMKKPFKKSHTELLTSYLSDEKSYVKIMRRLYPGPGNYTTLERSTIVYRILQSVPFGKPCNYVGIDALVDSDVFLDIYPLHDGPCYFVRGQSPLHLNGRQALYFCWANWPNLFKMTPIHLIREYLGERVGFFFAFHRTYNYFLLALSIVATWVFKTNYKMHLPLKPALQSQKGVNDIPLGDQLVCPKCQDFVACPLRKVSDYEREWQTKMFLDSPYNYVLIYVLTVFGILLYLLWRRTETYLYWFWEVPENDYASFARSEYRNMPKPKMPPPEKLTGNALPKPGDKIKAPRPKIVAQIMADYEALNKKSRVKLTRQYVALFMIVCFLFLGYTPLMTLTHEKLLNRLRYVEEMAGITEAIEQMNHFVVEICGTLNGLCVLAFDTVWWSTWKWLVQLDNPRSEEIYEKRHFPILFTVGCLIRFAVIFFYAFIKGVFYIQTNHLAILPHGWQFQNCGLLRCPDEVFILLISTFKATFCFQELQQIVKKRYGHTDALLQPFIGETPDESPVWEREFRLRPFTESTLTKMYYRLFLQYATVTFFITSFQLGPLFAFIYNCYLEKHYATISLVYSRRPLLTQSWGLGGWLYVLAAMPYVATLTNVAFSNIHNTLLHRRCFHKYWVYPYKTDIKNIFLKFLFGTAYFGQQGTAPELQQKIRSYQELYSNMPNETFCLYTSYYENLKDYYGIRAFPTAVFYHILWHQGFVMIFYLGLSFLTGALLHHLIKRKSNTLRHNIEAEDSVRRYQTTKEKEFLLMKRAKSQ